MRSVTLAGDGSDFATIRANSKDMYGALGYLLTWGWQPERPDDSVTVHAIIEHDLLELRAVYSPSHYVMGAIYRRRQTNPQWEFHS